MFSFLRKSPRAWAVEENGVWIKVISCEKPCTIADTSYLRGPFRSEIDCEDFCDKANLAKVNKFTLYQIGNKLD